jgi:hypothetical protein
MKLRLDVSQDNPTVYTLNIIVPQEITHDFKSEIILTHPKTQVQTKVPVTYSNIKRGGGDRLQREDYSEQR